PARPQMAGGDRGQRLSCRIDGRAAPRWRWPEMADDIERLAVLVDVVRRLRSPSGCPWDREQTHASLRATMLEEAYEVLEAIDERSVVKLREELGDVLLQVLMQAEIAAEAEEFSLGDLADTVREKLVRRHPHVFGSTTVSGSEEVLRNWEAMKAKEYGRESALDGVQRSLPALQWAWSLQRRAANVGVDWPDGGGAHGKVRAEVEGVRQGPTVEEGGAAFRDLRLPSL